MTTDTSERGLEAPHLHGADRRALRSGAKPPDAVGAQPADLRRRLDLRRP